MLAQTVAVVIFIAMFILIVMDKIERHHITIGCGVLTLVVVFGMIMKDGDAIIRTLNLDPIFTTHFWYSAGSSETASSGINWETIIFIAGMMIMVEGMARVGFFRWLCLKIASLVKYKTIPVFITFMIMSAVLAMFIDSITVILFLAAVTVELAKLLKFNPVPVILSEIFCARVAKASPSGRVDNAAGSPVSPPSRMLCTIGICPRSGIPYFSAILDPPSFPKM